MERLLRILVLTAIILVTLMHRNLMRAHSEEDRGPGMTVSFDMPLGRTDLQEVITLGMQVWGDLQAIAETEDFEINSAASHRLLELLIGRATLMRHTIVTLIQQKDITPEGRKYIVRIISRALHTIVSAPHLLAQDKHIAVLRNLLEDIHANIARADLF